MAQNFVYFSVVYDSVAHISLKIAVAQSETFGAQGSAAATLAEDTQRKLHLEDSGSSSGGSRCFL